MPSNLNSVKSVHVNRPLTNMSLGYHPTGLIAEMIFPVVPVVNESDDYYVWDKGQAFRMERSDGLDTLRADGTPAQIEDFGAQLKSYRAEEYARKTKITDRQRANQDPVLQLEVSKTRRVQDKLLLGQELRVAKLLLTSGNYASSNVATLSGTDQWNDASFVSQTSGTFSVIEKQFDAGREAIRIATGGKEPNFAIIPAPVARVMKRDVGIRDSIKYTDGTILENGTLPPMLWGLQVVVPAGIYNLAAEGETMSPVDVWGKNIVLGYRNPNPGIDDITLGMIFRARPWQVKQWRDEEINSTFYEASVVQSELLISADCGYLMQNVIA